MVHYSPQINSAQSCRFKTTDSHSVATAVAAGAELATCACFEVAACFVPTGAAVVGFLLDQGFQSEA